MSREIELKFDIAPGFGDIVQQAPFLGGQPPEQRDQAAVYFDTAAGDLRKAGFSLRIRRSGERWTQTVKHKPDSAAGMFDRQEWEWPVDGFDLDFDALEKTPLATLLNKKLRKKLGPLITTAVHRSLWRIARDGSEIELTLDEGAISGGGRTASVAELEIELRKGDPAALFALADALADTVPLRLGVLSKAERGYAIAQGKLGKAVKSEPIRLDPAMNVAQAFAATAYSCLRHFRLNEALLEQADAEALHQVRVGMRRLRSAFSLFRSVISDAAFDGLREEIRWFTNRLGAARDIDVVAQGLPSGKKPKKGEEIVRERLGEARDHAYADVMEALESDRFRAMMLNLLRWIEIGEWRSRPKAAKPLPPFAARQLGKRWRKIRAEGAMLSELDEESRHCLRIDIKKMRYSAEFLSGLQTGDEAVSRKTEFIAALETLQEQLGLLNDAVTGREVLSSLELESREEKKFALSLIPEEVSRRQSITAAREAYEMLLRTADYWS